jgi:[acyl-carrier-protein] S-malonyltransferase
LKFKTESLIDMSAITALLFPGQGSQYVGMGRDLYEAYPQAQAVFDQADDLLEDVPLLDLMFGATASKETATETLRQTENTQPALFVHSMAAVSVLSSSGFAADMAAGHSLGEYSALAASEAITFADGLELVRLRGLVMSEAGNDRPGAMAAVMGMEDCDVEDICNTATAETPGVVQAANYNAPGQIVISGDQKSVEKAMQLANEQGARRVVALPVSGAFHSPLMEPAREKFAGVLRDIVIREPICPVYLNVTARPTRDPEAIRAALLLQLTSPVRWVQTVRNMKADGTERFIELGPGSVLSGLVKRTLGSEVETSTAGKEKELNNLLKELADSAF